MVTDTLEATAYHAIEVRRVRPDLEQPRKTFDEEALQELARSLKSNGLLQPIVVRPYPKGNAGDYLLIAGERRWRAAGILGWDTIPALIRDDVTASEAAKLQLLENIVRRDLNPVEEARALQRMQDEGYTLKELSDATGIIPSQIAWRVKMLDAREDVLELVALGHIKPSMCYEMAKLSPDGQGRVLRAITGEKLNTDEVTQFCRHVLAEESQAQMFPETKLSKEQIRAVQTFGQAFAQIGRTLSRIQRMEEDQPGLLQKAFEAEAVVVEAQVDVSIQQLARIKRALRDVRIRQLVEVSN